MSNRKVIFAMSDLHSGFRLGLFNPETVFIDEKGNKKKIGFQSETQEFLWTDVYTWGIKETIKLAGKDDIYVLTIGDLTQGNHYISEQITTCMADQIAAAYYCFMPLLQCKNVKALRMALGTGSHEFGEGSTPKILLQMFQDKFPTLDSKVTYHGLANFDKYKIDYAHHGPFTGSRNWLRGNVAEIYLRSLMMDELDAGLVPPHLVLRGHYHTYVRRYMELARSGKDYSSWIVVMPSVCGIGDFAVKATQSIYRITPGVLAFEVIDNKLYDVHKFTKTVDFRTVDNF